jgi:hypothetical protein
MSKAMACTLCMGCGEPLNGESRRLEQKVPRGGRLPIRRAAMPRRPERGRRGQIR